MNESHGGEIIGLHVIGPHLRGLRKLSDRLLPPAKVEVRPCEVVSPPEMIRILLDKGFVGRNRLLELMPDRIIAPLNEIPLAVAGSLRQIEGALRRRTPLLRRLALIVERVSEHDIRAGELRVFGYRLPEDLLRGSRLRVIHKYHRLRIKLQGAQGGRGDFLQSLTTLLNAGE